MKTAPTLSWLTAEAYLPDNAGAAFGDPCPGRTLDLHGTGYVMQDRRRRPNQKQWLKARPLSGLAAPVLNGS